MHKNKGTGFPIIYVKNLENEKTNGDASFAVMSAKETYEYLKEQDVHFPVIGSQNSKQGIDKQPGYTQIVAADSEGNIITFYAEISAGSHLSCVYKNLIY